MGQVLGLGLDNDCDTWILLVYHTILFILFAFCHFDYSFVGENEYHLFSRYEIGLKSLCAADDLYLGRGVVAPCCPLTHLGQGLGPAPGPGSVGGDPA